ncbi:MAG: 3-hydroxyacyl-CoA dehydrogenase family protein [Candidatus Njordarchaeia archaeon]
MVFIQKVGVVGLGTMGSAIATVMILSNYPVVVKELNEEYLKAGMKRIEAFLDEFIEFQTKKADKEIADIERRYGITLTEEQKEQIRKVRKPRITEKDKERLLNMVHPTTNFEDFKDCDLIIEAVFEDLKIKQDLFKELEKYVSPRAVFGTNTSSLMVTDIAAKLEKPERLIGIHFFNPPTLLPLVEVTPGLRTRRDLVEDILDFINSLKNFRGAMLPIVVKDSPGFVVNRILGAMMSEAFHVYEEGLATIKDIDLAMKAGAGMPMGPFELADLVGLDIMEHVVESFRNYFGVYPTVRVSTLLKKYISAGWLGKKTKRGFYDYTYKE